MIGAHPHSMFPLVRTNALTFAAESAAVSVSL